MSSPRDAVQARRALCIVLAGFQLLLAACAVGPRHAGAPPVAVPQAFKQGEGRWIAASAPAGLSEAGPWWRAFGDAELAALAEQVELSNQSVAAAAAAYAQARALVAQQRAAQFPVLGADLGARRQGGGGGTPETNRFDLSLGASWEPDLWGRLARGVTAAGAGAQASEADLVAARLSARGEVLVNGIALRAADAQRALLARTIAGYERALQIATNRYNAGVVARTDVLQAQTQLTSARADLLDLERQRAQLEHAIAVLVGQPPAAFAIAPREVLGLTVPSVPSVLPSTLLRRRPDIVAAERRVAQANEQIGIAQSAWYPSLGLSASAGGGAARVGDLFNASSLVWAVGATLAQTLFDAGATTARVDAARAALEQQAARYRQTVLDAFRQVEDQLAALRTLAGQAQLRAEASDAADRVEQQVLNRYQAGQVSFSEVIAAQATAQASRRALVQVQASRLQAAVALVTATGGGWDGVTAGDDGAPGAGR